MNQSTYVAKFVGNYIRGEQNHHFEIKASTSTALFCPFSTSTSYVLNMLTVSQHAIPTDGERSKVESEKVRRVSQEIRVEQTAEGVYQVFLSNFESNQPTVLIPVDVWTNGNDGVVIYDRLDELDSIHLQIILNAIDQAVDGSSSTSVVVTRRLEIAEYCRNVVYVEDDRPYFETLNQGRKSFVVHLEPDAVVRKFYNNNGDKVAKSLREIGFYLHYGHSESIPKLLDYRIASHISIGYLSGQSLSKLRIKDDQSRIELTRRYALAVTQLFRDAKPISDVFKNEYYSGVGAKTNFEAVLDGLRALAAIYAGCDRFQELVSKVEKIRISDELVITLDWNSANVIVSANGQFSFIDFEQAFIGSSEMLAGILLHNPVWCARTLVRELRNQSLVCLDDEELSSTVHFAFAYVLIDSISRTGSPWSVDRFEAAFERHVTERLIAIGDR